MEGKVDQVSMAIADKLTLMTKWAAVEKALHDMTNFTNDCLGEYIKGAARTGIRERMAFVWKELELIEDEMTEHVNSYITINNE